jgi:hypothetical protein
MTVTIDKMATRCRASRRHEAAARLVDRVARQRLATELTELIGPALARQAPVVRIRRLSVKLELAASEMSEDTLTAVWARAVARSLFEALAYPTGSGSIQIVRADSPAAFRAAFLRDLLSARAGGRWEYAEFDELLRLPPIEAAVSLLLREPEDLVATLVALDGSPALRHLISGLDQMALERLFIAIARLNRGDPTAPLTLADLLWTAREASDAPLPHGLALDGRRQALWIFVRTRGGEGRPPRRIFHALLALSSLLEWPRLLVPDTPDVPHSLEELERRTGRRLPSAVSSLLLQLAGEAEADRRAGTSRGDPSLVQLLAAVDRLRPLAPTAAPAPERSETPWIEIESASLLLLAGIVQRLGWDVLRSDSLLEPWGGHRFFQVLLSGIGSAVLERLVTESEALDPAVVFFAGMEREPNMIGLRHSLASINADGRRQLLARLLPENTDDGIAVDWAATFDALAAKLIHEFASLIRGFREAPRPAIVRQFLRTPGRVQTSEQVVSVLLASSPYHVALHISGMDDPLPSVSWMGGRRLEFRLLGL